MEYGHLDAVDLGKYSGQMVEKDLLEAVTCIKVSKAEGPDKGHPMPHVHEWGFTEQV